jgi:hypothetical protein
MNHSLSINPKQKLVVILTGLFRIEMKMIWKTQISVGVGNQK